MWIRIRSGRIHLGPWNLIRRSEIINRFLKLENVQITLARYRHMNFLNKSSRKFNFAFYVISFVAGILFAVGSVVYIWIYSAMESLWNFTPREYWCIVWNIEGVLSWNNQFSLKSYCESFYVKLTETVGEKILLLLFSLWSDHDPEKKLNRIEGPQKISSDQIVN